MKRWTLITVGLLTLFALVSCTTTQTPTPAPPTATEPAEPTATMAPPSPTPEEEDAMDATATPAEDGEDGEVAPAPELESDALAGLESYRAEISWETSLAEGAGQGMTINVAETRDPKAQHLALSGMGTEIEFITTPDGSWVKVGGQWQSLPGGNMESFFGEMTFIAPEDVNELAAAESDADYEFVGTETVNGIQTRHYRINVDPDQLQETTGATDVQAVQGDVWVADEGDLPAFAVRFVVESEVEIEGQTGTATLNWNVQEVNTGITIEPPEGM